MVHVYNIFEIAGFGLVLSIVFLTFSCYGVSGVEFEEKPENVTLSSSWKQFTLNCSVDVATPEGIDWVAFIDEKKIEIFSTQTRVRTPGYSIEWPSNRTVNLIINAVNFQNSSVAGEYCCRGENGAGTSTACAYVNFGVSQSPNTDITKANEATTNIATSTDLSTTSSGAWSSEVAAIVVPIVIVFIIVLVTLLVCFRDRRCPIHKRRHAGSESRNNGTPRERADLV